MKWERDTASCISSDSDKIRWRSEAAYGGKKGEIEKEFGDRREARAGIRRAKNKMKR